MSKWSKLAEKMAVYESDCVARVNHYLKVFVFAKIIAEGENIPAETQEILEAAALVHDIGIRPSLEKFGHCTGKMQEENGPPVAAEMLPACGYTPAQTERVCYLIAHHHTYDSIDGPDYQILVEADFLVNIFEGEMERSAVENVKETIFRTKTGTELLTTLFLN